MADTKVRELTLTAPEFLGPGSDDWREAYKHLALSVWELQRNIYEVLANLDDDWAADTWTPTLYGLTTAGTQAYTTQVGQYVKMRELVIVWGVIVLSSTSGMAGNVAIGGLPYVAAAFSSGAYAGFVSQFSSIDLDVRTQLGIQPIAGESYMELWESGDNVAAQNITAADIGNSSAIHFGAVYKRTV